jgi:hypothetical protein
LAEISYPLHVSVNIDSASILKIGNDEKSSGEGNDIKFQRAKKKENENEEQKKKEEGNERELRGNRKERKKRETN